MNGLLGNPAVHLGSGLLSASGPSFRPLSPAQGLSTGLLSLAQGQQQQRQNQIQNMKLRMVLEDRQREAEAARKKEAFMATLNPQQRMLLQAGVSPDKVLMPPQGPDPTTAQREYDQARAQGFQGTFLDYQKALAEAKRPVTNVTTNVAGAPSSTVRALTPDEAGLLPPGADPDNYLMDLKDGRPIPKKLAQEESEELKTERSLRSFKPLIEAYRTAATKAATGGILGISAGPDRSNAQAARQALVAWVAKNVLGTPGAEPTPRLYEQAEQMVPDFSGPYDAAVLDRKLNQLEILAAAPRGESPAAAGAPASPSREALLKKYGG